MHCEKNMKVIVLTEDNFKKNLSLLSLSSSPLPPLPLPWPLALPQKGLHLFLLSIPLPWPLPEPLPDPSSWTALLQKDSSNVPFRTFSEYCPIYVSSRSVSSNDIRTF